jgi:hypothetical protein
MVPQEILLGLTQGEITSIIIVAVGALLALFLLSVLLRIGAALMRIGCLMVVLLTLVFTATQMLNG